MITHSKFIFLHLQKCAGSFTEDFLLRAFKGAQHISPRHQALKKRPDNIFTFGNVRNPWDWYVSWWAANTIFRQHTHTESFLDFLHAVLGTAKGRCHDVNFDFIKEQDIGVLTYRYKKVYNIRPDFICKIENLQSDIIKCFEKFNFPLSQERIDLFNENQKVNVSTRNIDYHTYYDEESISLVAHKDRYIIKKHNYDY